LKSPSRPLSSRTFILASLALTLPSGFPRAPAAATAGCEHRERGLARSFFASCSATARRRRGPSRADGPQQRVGQLEVRVDQLRLVAGLNANSTAFWRWRTLFGSSRSTSSTRSRACGQIAGVLVAAGRQIELFDPALPVARCSDQRLAQRLMRLGIVGVIRDTALESSMSGAAGVLLDIREHERPA